MTGVMLMKCAWSAFINVLPIWMRQEVDKLGKESLLEIRLRHELPPELILIDHVVTMNRIVTKDDLTFCVNVATQYSPWSSATVANGYITIEGGHRIGICGHITKRSDKPTGYRFVTSLCIRVAREFPCISDNIWKLDSSILIIGRPGSGKTTLLRDLIAQKSNRRGSCVCVIDEKCELFPYYNGESCFNAGTRTDVISGCSKRDGIEIAIRNMNPDIVAFDEITAAEDCEAMLHAGWCGVQLIGTAHAGSRQDLITRPIYKPIIENKLFDTLVIMKPDKSWSVERL